MLQWIFMCFLFPADFSLLRETFGPANSLFFFLLVKLQSKSLCLCASARHANVCPVCYWIASWTYILALSLVIMSSLNKGFYKQMHISKSAYQNNCSLKPIFAKATILGIHFKDTDSFSEIIYAKKHFIFASEPK